LVNLILTAGGPKRSSSGAFQSEAVALGMVMKQWGLGLPVVSSSTVQYLYVSASENLPFLGELARVKPNIQYILAGQYTGLIRDQRYRTEIDAGMPISEDPSRNNGSTNHARLTLLRYSGISFQKNR
jgi:hypothetical protein